MKFTEQEAENCYISYCEKISIDEIFDKYVLLINDDNGFQYLIEDDKGDIPFESGTDEEIKTSIINKIMELDKTPLAPVITTESLGIVGKVMDIGTGSGEGEEEK